MSGFGKNPFGGGSFKASDQNTANLFGSISRGTSQNKDTGIVMYTLNWVNNSSVPLQFGGGEWGGF